MNNSCAIFMKADPFMKKDLDTIKKILKIFSHVDIILDRKWQTDKYTLSFADRADIIRRDMKDAGISEYTILANDTSRYDSAIKAQIRNLAVELNSYSNMDEMYERDMLVRKMIPGINVVMIPQFDGDLLISQQNLLDLILEDHTHQLYKRYISDFAYIKTKFKLMPKIGITGNRGCDFDSVIDTFEDRDYEVIDLRKMISDSLQNPEIFTPAFKELEKAGIKTKKLTSTMNGKLHVEEDEVVSLCLSDKQAYDIWFKRIQDNVRLMIMRQVMQSNRKVIVIVTTLLFELKIDSMFKYIITVSANEDAIRKNLLINYDIEQVANYMKLYMPINEKVRLSDMYIDCSDGKDATVRNTINLINKRLEAGF